jgi:hypothetical protein
MFIIQATGMTRKYQTWQERLVLDKHSSLIYPLTIDKGESFMTLTTAVDAVKLFFHHR